MNEAIALASSWHSLVIALLTFGVFPRTSLRLIIRLWPKGDPVREELMANLTYLPYWRRPFYVADQLESGLFDGLRTRLKNRGSSSTTSTKPAEQVIQVDAGTIPSLTASGGYVLALSDDWTVNRALLQVDHSGTVTAFSAEAEQLLGYAASEVVGIRSIADFIDPNQIDERRRTIDRMRSEPRAVRRRASC